MERKMRTFEAMRANHTTVIIDEYQTLIVVGTGGECIHIPGATRFSANGGAVERINDKRFWLVQMGEFVTPV